MYLRNEKRGEGIQVQLLALTEKELHTIVEVGVGVITAKETGVDLLVAALLEGLEDQDDRNEELLPHEGSAESIPAS